MRQFWRTRSWDFGDLRIAITLLLILIVASIIVFWIARGVDPTVRSTCQHLYRQARTAADSAIIDQHRPVVGRGTLDGSPMCLEVRRGMH